MYARVLTFQVEPTKVEDFASRVRDTLAPAVAQQQGFSGGLLLTDRRTGKVMTVSLWETEAALLAAEPAGRYQPVLGMLLGVVPGSEVQETYAVSATVGWHTEQATPTANTCAAGAPTPAASRLT